MLLLVNWIRQPLVVRPHLQNQLNDGLLLIGAIILLHPTDVPAVELFLHDPLQSPRDVDPQAIGNP